MKDNSTVLKTTEDWFHWLSEEEAKTRNAYLAKPANLISDYRNELATTRDYQGREILELLQNAADQAREAEIPGKVVIQLTPEGLVVANNGTPFSIGGVLSLENAYLSPKHHKRRQFIGSKGLGFRSVLNWTSSPIIMSGSLGLAYSKSVLGLKIKEFENRKSEISSLIREEKSNGNDVIGPILKFAGYTKNGNIDEFITDKNNQFILERCKHWRSEGYSTVIGMPFEKQSFLDDAIQQIDSLRPEILLFVKYLNKISFILPDNEYTWTQEGDDNASMVMENGEPKGIWKVIRTDGEIPADQLDKDQRSPLNYEIIIAVPEIETKEELKTSPLFSYFPTKVTLPLPIVCHATLELDQSRNHINPIKSNRYVIKQLANFLTKAAEDRAEKYTSGIKAGFRLLMPQGLYSNDLIDLNFDNYLNQFSKKRKIIPTIQDQALLVNDALLLPGANESWLPSSSFNEIVTITDNREYEFFKTLGVKELTIEKLKQKLLNIKFSSLNQRVNLIAGILKHNIASDAHLSSLLLDKLTNIVHKNTFIFIAPKGGSIPQLPRWVTLKFLDDDLQKALMAKLKAKDVRELQNKLSSFGLREYSLSRLLSRLIASANSQKKETPELNSEIQKELLLSIFQLYRSESQSGSCPAFPTTSKLLLPTQNGKSGASDELYMGKGFGTIGNIVQDLYQNWAPHKLIIKPEELNLCSSAIELSKFLEWLGVAKWPKIKNLSQYTVDQDYKAYLLDCIKYPVSFEEYHFPSLKELKQANIYINELKSIDGLEEILKSSNPTAITAWLARDSRAFEWNRWSKGWGQLSALRGYDRNHRVYDGKIPCFIRWKIETTDWLMDKDRKPLRPKDCVLGQRAIEDLFPKPTKPNLKDLEHYGIREGDLIEGWRRSGVLTSLAELELEDLYARLIELPEKLPDGKYAKQLYRWLMDAEDEAIGEGKAAQERFFNEGKMWGYGEGKYDYFSVSELYHADSEGLPKALLDQLKIVDLPYRVGAKKVKRVFGVKSIERIDIKQKMKKYVLAKDLSAGFQSAKPYLYRLRASQSSRSQYLNRLKRLTLKVCSSLSAEMEYEGKIVDFELPIWGWMIDNETLFIRSDPTEIVDKTSALLGDAIGAAIASLFRIGDGGSFAQMFLCPEKDRKFLLKRMRGEAADEDMDRIIQEFSLLNPDDIVNMLPEVGPIEAPKENEKDIEPEKLLDKETIIEQKSETDNTETNEDISIQMVEHQPKSEPVKQRMRIHRKYRTTSTRTSITRITDSEFIERKVLEIENSFQPARYPLRVGHIVGFDAPGCDILSFKTEDHREKFRSGKDRNMKVQK